MDANQGKGYYDENFWVFQFRTGNLQTKTISIDSNTIINDSWIGANLATMASSKINISKTNFSLFKEWSSISLPRGKKTLRLTFTVPFESTGEFIIAGKSKDNNLIISILDPTWYNVSYTYRMKLTTDVNASAPSALTNFVSLVSLNSTTHSAFWSHSCSDGNLGIDFIDDDNVTDLNWHMEDSNTTNRYYWVKIPSVTYNAAGDSIYVYYDNDDCVTNNQNETGTYDINFKAVSHMGDWHDQNKLKDSTANAQHASLAKGNPTERQSISVIGKDINIHKPSFEWYNTNFKWTGSQKKATIMMWVLSPVIPATAIGRRPFGEFQTSPSVQVYATYITQDSTMDCWSALNVSGTAYDATCPANTIISTTRFYQLVALQDGAKNSIIVDANVKGSTNMAVAMPVSTYALAIGAVNRSDVNTNTDNFGGWIDEVRILDRALSTNEIQAYYKSDQGNFFTIGSEEIGTVITPCSCPTSGNWEITTGNYCLLSTTCNSTGTLHIANGAALHIASGGILNIPSTFKAIIEFGGRLSINSGASFRVNK